MNEYEYLREQRYFAIVTGSLERHAADEAAGLGARILQTVPRGFSFCCDQAALYRIIISSRLIQGFAPWQLRMPHRLALQKSRN